MRPAVVGELPRSLYLETTNRCDSKCQTCVRTFRTLEPPADLTLERARAIAEQFPRLDRVVLHGIGEPLLNPEIFAIIAFFKTRAGSVLFNSDAISLTPGRAARLIESGLDEYRVSVDAATRATYRRVRGVDQFDRVVGNVRGLVERQRETSRTTPRVSLWFTASRVNVDELPAFVDLAADLGVAEVYVQRLVFNDLGLATEANALHGRLRLRERARLDGREPDEEEVERKVRELLETVELDESADAMPADLSTGMKRAVAVARALAAEPDCILYDEPTTMVDPLMAATITALILRLKEKFRKTSIVVTHDVRLAERVADRLVMLCDGRVCFFGTAEEWQASADPEVESFRTLDAMPSAQ